MAWACEHKSPIEPTPPPATCTFTLSETSLTFGAVASPGSVNVWTAASCVWTATSARGWMTITAGATGTGPGTVSVALTANTSPDARTGGLTIAGRAVAVTQAGAQPACTVVVSPASATFTKDAANGTFTVTTPASCAWSAASSDGWITITSGAGGTGTAVVAYSVARNTGTAPRTGTIRVGEAAFSVSQQGDLPACTFQVSPVTINACMSVGYELVVNVATQPACAWTAATDTPWVAMTAASQAGSGDIRFKIGDNYDAPRLGVVRVRWDTPTAGQNVQIAQAGCRYAVSTTSLNLPADGGTFSFDVLQQSDPLECGGPLQNGCVWSAATTAPWITITSSMPRAGDDRVTFAVSSNSGGQRSAPITVRDKTVTIVQASR
jgi:hypothetical protein